MQRIVGPFILRNCEPDGDEHRHPDRNPKDDGDLDDGRNLLEDSYPCDNQYAFDSADLDTHSQEYFHSDTDGHADHRRD